MAQMLQRCLMEAGLGIIDLDQPLHEMFHLVVEPLPHVTHGLGRGSGHPGFHILLDTGQLLLPDGNPEVVGRDGEHRHVHAELGRDLVIVGVVILTV